MSPTDNTCWQLIKGAATGVDEARSEFAARYGALVQAFFRARWRGSHWIADVDDAVNEVFLECFRDGGALDRAEPDRPGGFRAFLYGVVRNVARRFEEHGRRNHARAAQGDGQLETLPCDETSLSRRFDRGWALAVLRRAQDRHRRAAERAGERALWQIDILRLRFEENLAIRDIAQRGDHDPDLVHREYRLARREFRRHLDAELLAESGDHRRIDDIWRDFTALLR